jgi:hypothetical protein
MAKCKVDQNHIFSIPQAIMLKPSPEIRRIKKLRNFRKLEHKQTVLYQEGYY